MTLSFQDKITPVRSNSTSGLSFADKIRPVQSSDEQTNNQTITPLQTVHNQFQQTQPSTLQKINNVTNIPSDLSIGGVKGAVDIPREAASLGSNIGNALSNHPAVQQFTDSILKPILQKILTPDQMASVHNTLSQLQGGLQGGTEQTYTKPDNTAQNIGYGAEKVGEFFVPGLGEEAVATKATELAEKYQDWLKKLRG